MPSCRDVKVPRCRGAEVSRCRDVEMPRCRDVEVSRCRDVETSRCRGVEMSRCRGVEMTRYRGVDMPRCRDAEMSRCRDVEVSRCRGAEMSRCYASELGYTVTRDRVPVTQSEGTCGFNSARAACVLRMGKDDGRWSYTTSVFHAVDEQWVREGFGSILRLDRDRSPWLSESEIAALVTRWNPDNGADRSDPLTAPLFSLHENGYQQRAAPALWVTIDTLDSFVRRIAEDAHTHTPIPLNNPAIAIVNLGDSRTRGWHWICAAWSRGGV